jgi:hypothetical protein
MTAAQTAVSTPARHLTVVSSGKAPKAKVAKTTKAKKPAVAKVRAPAKELMAARRRMFFGASYMNGVLGGFHRDVAKMVQHAAHLKLGSPSQLKALKVETLREKLADAILSTPNGSEPFSIKLQ